MIQSTTLVLSDSDLAQATHKVHPDGTVVVHFDEFHIVFPTHSEALSAAGLFRNAAHDGEVAELRASMDPIPEAVTS